MIFFIIIIFIIIFVCINNKEYFGNTTDEYTYNYTKLNDAYINDKVHEIMMLAKKSDKKLENINNMIMKIYHDSQTNMKLKDYLKFMNFMNDDNTIFFSNENPDVYLFNKIKILVILVPGFSF